MKFFIYIYFLLLLFIPTHSHSIEQSDAIKITPVLKTQTSWDGKDIVYPQGKAEVTGMIVEIAPGGETGWHSHPVPSFGMVLEGELEVHFKNGDVKHLKAGESAAEVVNTLHNGRNPGKVPVKLVVFYAGTVDQKLTVKEDSKQETKPAVYTKPK
jgi:quercetin dioxygenase-like cupin family protein